MIDKLTKANEEFMSKNSMDGTWKIEVLYLLRDIKKELKIMNKQ